MDRVKRETTILIINTDVEGLAKIAGPTQAMLKGFDLDWDPGYQFARDVDATINLFRIGFKPNVIMIKNDAGLSHSDMQLACVRLADDLNARDLTPWICIEDDDLAALLLDIFKQRGLVAHNCPVIGVISDEEEERSKTAA